MAEGLRLATWNAELGRAGPGLLLRDILKGDDPQIAAAVQVIAALDADVLLLTGVDFDHGLVALTALEALLPGAGYPHLLALRPNTGMATGLDLDGDGRLGSPRDAQGWGRFAGAGGMAILSRVPVDRSAVRDLSAMLWRDLPGAILPPGYLEAHAAVQRLSTTGHWVVPLVLPGGGRLTLLAWHATPPVFDGPEDRNGRRNHDEAALWLRLMEGTLGPVPEVPFVIIGDANLDPEDGEGRRQAIRSLLSHPALQDPAPKGTHGRTEPAHKGDAALDTALFDPGPGGLRVDLVLPSADLTVTASGVLWPPDGDPLAATLRTASRHRPVWVEVDLPTLRSRPRLP
ncbi:MAG: endonuclease/exonuclease/phosphatase family protein [Gemmobacter sp.]